MTFATRLRVLSLQLPEAHKERGMEFIDDTASKAGQAGRPILLMF
jgi:hypothetical protein